MGIIYYEPMIAWNGEEKGMKAREKRNPLDHNQKWALFFCAPNMLFFLVFFVVPASIGLWYSFTNYNGLKRMDYVGLANYANLLHDSEFWMVLGNTVKYVLVSVPIGYVVSLLLALLLSDETIKGNSFTRVLVYWPTLISTIMVGLTWKWIFSETFGVANYLLQAIGAEPVKWFSKSGPAFWTTVVASVWSGCGVSMLIFLGGIKQIPAEHYDAAKIDGANRVQSFFAITLPALRPVSFMIIMTSIINAFKVFAMILTLTNGGPGTATTYIIQYIYTTGFDKMKVGYSSAASMIMFVLLLVISLIQTRINERYSD
jgi:alpha-1,4-digalacturonate transport system permease protein